jgi:Ca-activated chloride channel family protein
MTLRILISLSLLLLLAGQKARAQLAPAEDFFNSGAQLYISNNVPAALQRVEDGLKTYPDDAKLKKLEELLKQQQQQQQQQQQNQQQQQQKNQQQNPQNQQQQDQQKSQEQKNQEEQKKEEQKKAEQQKQQQQQQQQEKKEGDKQDQQAAEGQPKPGQLTPEEAKRLLDAQKGDEQLLQMKPPEKPRDTSHPIKDW